MALSPLAPVEYLISVFGPFVIPVLLFVAGFIGYLVIMSLQRAGLVGRGAR